MLPCGFCLTTNEEHAEGCPAVDDVSWEQERALFREIMGEEL